ncbi:MAG: outer membrane protein [Mesorhizobium sp.]
MKKLLIASFAATALASTAQAQGDTYDWTGFYLGLQAGYGDSSARFDASNTSFAGNYHDNAFVGGVFAGFDWQNGPIVYGVLADFDWVQGDDVGFGNVDPLTGGKGEAYTYDVDWIATARARLGYAATDRLLVFATGGVAAGQFQATSYNYPFFGSPASAAFSGVKWGGVGGLGIDYALAGNLSIKGEYLHYRFDRIDFDSGGLADARFSPKLDAMKLGIALRF